MNKKTVSKVNLFFDGLVSRMEENKDFFNDITINLKTQYGTFQPTLTNQKLRLTA